MRYILFLLFWSPLLLHAQDPDIDRQQLDTVVVTATRIATPLKKVPAAVSVFKASPLDATRQQTSLQEYLLQMPGVFTQNATNYAQDLRISIRGFGARAAFGIRGIKLIVDGIPETTPDGQGQLDNLNLGIIDKIEVLKGPSSSLYGNASGGVIAISTLSDFQKDFYHWKAAIGAYGFQNYQLTAGITNNKATYVLHGNYGRANNYRTQSEFEQINTNFSGRFELSDRLALKTIVNFSDAPLANDPGGLTLEEFEANPRQARDRNLLFQTGEAIRQFKVGTSLDWKLPSKGNFQKEIQSYLFYIRRDFDGLLPFEFGGAVALARNYTGQGSAITIKKGHNNLKIGYDAAYQSDQRQRFLNQEGVVGASTLDQLERFTNLGVFVVNQWQPAKWAIQTGVRFDYNKLEVIDQFQTNGNASGAQTLNAFNPSFGVNYSLSPRHQIYTTVATSFETPSLSELSANPEGDQGFNASLQPQKALNLELGWKANLSTSVQFDIALFRILTTDDLVPFELANFPDRVFYRNAGETIRNGVELAGVYAFAKAWRLGYSYTYSDFSYKKYATPSGVFDGNALPGLPKHRSSLQLEYAAVGGLQATLSLNMVGKQYADDANQTSIAGYELVNLRLGYPFSYKTLRLQPYLGCNNLLDQTYTDNVRINAFGKRYYEPAPGINIFGGVIAKL